MESKNSKILCGLTTSLAGPTKLAADDGWKTQIRCVAAWHESRRTMGGPSWRWRGRCVGRRGYRPQTRGARGKKTPTNKTVEKEAGTERKVAQTSREHAARLCSVLL
ncbi:unnamed protein product, partial [Ixodes persulcatus]